MVEMTGFEPTTSWSRTKRATKLRYISTFGVLYTINQLADFENLAEEVGFEPTCPCGQLDFESSSLQPLRYSSSDGLL